MYLHYLLPVLSKAGRGDADAVMSNLGTCRFWTHVEESGLIQQSHTDTRRICVPGDELGEPSAAIRCCIQKASLRTRDQLQRRRKDTA
jgi:hypothetical protein